VIAAETHRRPTAIRPGRQGGLRLVHLHLLSRRIPTAVLALAGCGVVLAVAVMVHWTGGRGAPPQLSSLIEGAAAALIAVTTRNPFGDPERVAGRWLPALRLAIALALTGIAAGSLAAGSAAGSLPGGELAMIRNLAGIVGLGLICASVLGGALAWVGALAYLSLVEYAFGAAWQSPWTWPTRPPDDTGAALCAGLAFAAGLLFLTILGPRETA
jgi:hypothetical protein